MASLRGGRVQGAEICDLPNGACGGKLGPGSINYINRQLRRLDEFTAGFEDEGAQAIMGVMAWAHYSILWLVRALQEAREEIERLKMEKEG